MAFTIDDFVSVLEGFGSPDTMLVAELVRRHPEVVRPFLGRLQARLVSKGVIPAEEPGITDAEQAVQPLLRKLDDALRSGGSEAALAELRAMAADPQSRRILQAVVEAG